MGQALESLPHEPYTRRFFSYIPDDLNRTFKQLLAPLAEPGASF